MDPPKSHKVSLDKSSYLKKQPPENKSQSKVLKTPKLNIISPKKLTEDRLTNFNGSKKTQSRPLPDPKAVKNIKKIIQKKQGPEYQ